MNAVSMLNLALAYVRRGVAVFPCREGDSKGGSAKAPYNEGGWHRATTDERQIIAWWQIWPNAVVGLPCRMNGIIAIDADKHGQDDGVSTLFDLFTTYNFVPYSAPYVQTQRYGLHCLFRRPTWLEDTKAKIAPAIDVRDNAYIIAAGSVMANGLRYTLLNGSLDMLAVAIGGDTLPELPGWLAAMMAKPVTTAQRRTTVMNLTDHDIDDVRRRLTGLVRTVALASPGERNAKLHWAACRVGEMVQAGLITEDVALALLAEAGTYAGLPARETGATVKSGLGKGSGGSRRGR